MSKSISLLKNVGLLTLSNFGSKILVFLLVPLYTSVLTTEQYGVYDLLYSFVQLMFPLLTFNIVDAVTRFALDRETNKSEVVQLGGMLLLFSGVLLTIGLYASSSVGRIMPIDGYRIDVLLLYFSFGGYQLLSQFSRGVDRVSDLAAAGVINTASMLVLNIMFLVKFKWGLHGFFIANCISMAVPTAFLAIRLRAYIFKVSRFNYRLFCSMLKYATPLLFTTIGWWIINLSNRFVVAGMCGLSESGLYSAASKIPAILNMFQVVFVQAWLISAVKEFDRNDSDGFFALTYQRVNTLMVLICSALIGATPLLAKILFANEFFEAWRYVPFSLVFIVLNTMSGVWGGIFSSVKDSKNIAITSTVSSIANVVFSVFLVGLMGTQGAALASVCAGLIIWLMRGQFVKLHIKSNFENRKCVLMYLLLLVQAAALILFDAHIGGYFISVLIFSVLILINSRSLFDILSIAKRLLYRREN